MIEILACDARAYIKDGKHHLDFTIPQTHVDFLCTLAEGVKTRRCNQLYLKVGLPRKPRTTGYRSQNSHIHGHALTIAEYTGDYKEDVIAEAKRRAVVRGYRTHVDSFGNIGPISEKDATTEEAGYIIEELHKIADEMDIRLKEYDDE